MKRFTLIVLIIIALPVSLYSQDKITIATFNCEFLTRPKVHIKFGLPFNIKDASHSERQQWEQPGYRDTRFNEAAREVAGIIHSINADVIALTEVGNETDIEELRDEIYDLGTDYPYSIVCESRDTYTKQYVAALSKFPLSNPLREIPGREFYLEEPDDPETENESSVSKGLRVTFTAYGKDFHLYVIHLSSERGGYEQDQRRIAQASIVRRHYLPALMNGENVIVAGDLNEKKGQPTLQRIRGLHDIYGDLMQTGHAKYFDESELDTRWTYEFMGVRQQIDHILVSSSIKEICKIRGGITARTMENISTLASDHHPIIVTINLKN